jgi:hypothetical protein
MTRVATEADASPTSLGGLPRKVNHDSIRKSVDTDARYATLVLIQDAEVRMSEEIIELAGEVIEAVVEIGAVAASSDSSAGRGCRIFLASAVVIFVIAAIAVYFFS